MELLVLGSGSKGNAAIFHADNQYVLIDAGLSAKQIELRMAAKGLSVDCLSAILLTHEHSDHTKGLKVLGKKIKIPIYCTRATSIIVKESGVLATFKTFEAGADFQIGNIQIQSFSVQHDAVDPVGYTLSINGKRWGFLSDVGHITQSLLFHLKDLDGLFVEANYDEVLLEQDFKRPWSIKQRISSHHGHLSNRQVLELLDQIAHESFKILCLGHLSSDCNDSTLVEKLCGEFFITKGWTGVRVSCAQAESPHGWLALK